MRISTEKLYNRTELKVTRFKWNEKVKGIVQGNGSGMRFTILRISILNVRGREERKHNEGCLLGKGKTEIRLLNL